MFSSKTLAFLAENRAMNSREWFGAHKDEYHQYVLEPLKALVKHLTPLMNEIDEQMVTIPAVDKTVSRIWCDVRFSRGMLFREQQWISIRRDKKQFPAWPEFFMVLSPREFFWGCGYYAASAETMAAIRGMILEGHPKFLAAKAAYDAQSVFHLTGDCFKRTRYPSASEELREWLDRKSLCFMNAPSQNELFAEDLAEKMASSFRAMKPVYDFLIYAEDVAGRG